MNITNRIIYLLFLCVVCFSQFACAAKTPKPPERTFQEVMSAGLEEGKALVFLQIVPGPVSWSLPPYRSTALDYGSTGKFGYHEEPYDPFWNPYGPSFRVGGDYRAVLVQPGTYAVTTLRDYGYDGFAFAPQSASGKGFGLARLVRTPEQHRKSSGKYRDIGSSYYSIYDFPKAPPAYVGTITIEPGEILLIPSVSGDVKAIEKSMVQVEGRQSGPVGKVLNAAATLTLGLIGDPTENGTSWWVWVCEVGEIILDVSTPDLEDFLAKVDKEIVPPEMLETIKTIDFTFGPLFSVPHGVREISGTYRGKPYKWTQYSFTEDGVSRTGDDRKKPPTSDTGFKVF